MSSSRFAHLIARYPKERGAIQRLERLLDQRDFVENKEYTLGRLFDLLHARSLAALSFVMAELVREGIFRFSIRVEPEAGMGLGEYERIEEIPAAVHDQRRDVEIEVTADILRPIYRPTPKPR